MTDDIVVGLQDGRVRLLPHSDEWKHLYQLEKERLETALAPYRGTLVLDFQHVGSTSIPGIPAKPIIDIAVAVTDHDAARVTVEPLERLGYVYLGEHEVPGRHFFYLGEATTTGRTHHLHMLELKSQEWRQQLGFRDYLTNHPATAAAYADLKTHLSQLYPEDRPAYLDGKAPFITEVLRLSVPEGPLLWTTLHDHDSGISLAYSQQVADQPVRVEIGQTGVSRRIHAMSEDRRALYFEVAVYDAGLEVREAYAQMTGELRDRFDTLVLTELRQTTLGSRPAEQFSVAWDQMRREVYYVRGGGLLFRIIYDPRGPLNLAILDNLSLPGEAIPAQPQG